MPVWTLKCRFGRLSAGFGALSAGFAGKKDEKNEEKKIKISRKASSSCALNNTNSWLLSFQSEIPAVSALFLSYFATLCALCWAATIRHLMRQHSATPSRKLGWPTSHHVIWDFARHLQSPKPRNPEKSQKVSRKEFGTPRPRTPEKFRKKVRKVRKIVKINYFFDFSDLFRNFLGVRGRGVPNSSRETFLRLFGVSGFWAL